MRAQGVVQIGTRCHPFAHIGERGVLRHGCDITKFPPLTNRLERSFQKASVQSIIGATSIFPIFFIYLKYIFQKARDWTEVLVCLLYDSGPSSDRKLAIEPVDAHQSGWQLGAGDRPPDPNVLS